MATKKTEKQLLLKYAVEQATLAKVKAANQQLKQSMLDVGKAAKTGGAAGSAEFKRLGREANKLESELLDVRGGFDSIGSDAPKELQDVIDKVDDLNKSIKRGSSELRDFDDEFGKVSKDVALAGDVESQARTVGGAVGALGGESGVKIERGISGISELPAVIEALPKLKASLAGLPMVLKSAALAMGPTGLGLAAVAAITAVAVSGLVSNMQKQAAAARALIAAEEDFFTIRETGTKDAAQAEVEANEEQLRILNARRESLKELKAIEDAANLAATAHEKNLLVAIGTGIADAFSSDAAEEYGKELKEIEAEMVTLLDTNNLLIVGLTENVFVTETAADTLARLNQEETERTALLLAGAEQIKQDTLNQRDLMRQTTEQLDAALLALDDKAIALHTSVAALRAIENPTDEILAQIEAEKVRFEGLRQERAFILTFAREAAVAREAEATALEDQVKASEAAADAAQNQIDADRKVLETIRETVEKRIALEKKQANELIALSERAAEAEAKVLSQFEDKLADLNKSLGRDQADTQRKQQRKVLEAQVEAQREQVQQFRDHARALQDIRRRADESEFTLRQNRDFKGVANARRSARISIQDEQRNFAQKQADAAEQLQQEASDRQRAFAEERADRIRKFRQDIMDARANFMRQRNDAILAGRQAIMDARAKHQQELMDLHQAGLQKLQVRKQISDIEVAMIRNIATAASNVLSGIASSFQAFGGGNSSVVNNRSSSQVSNNVNVSGQNLNDPGGIAGTIVGVLQRLVS